MALLVWDQSGERRYEAGVDHAVLYPRGGVGVVWNGLISVNEIPANGGVSSYYIDGIKYLDKAIVDEFTARLEAYTYPDEFSECEGFGEHAWGFRVGNQRRLPFDLSYRTKVGNDVDGADHGYKLHFIYNALAASSDRNYQTYSDSPEPVTFSWEITTTPVLVPGFRPSAHIILDSTRMPPEAMAVVEAALYGSETTDPTFPQPGEIIALIESSIGLTVVVDENGVFTASGPDTAVSLVSPTTYQLSANNVDMVDPNTFVVTDEL